MRLKYLILLVSCFTLINENAFGELTLKNIFSIPGQINIKTGEVGEATTRDEIKKALEGRLLSVLETKKNIPNDKIKILSTLTNNVVNGLTRSGGYPFVQYGTQLSKATLQDFNEIIESTLKVEPILLTPAILNKPNQTTIDPGSKRAGAKPEDEPDDTLTPKTFELQLQQWIDFLKYYDQQHKDIPGAYYVLNPIKVYNDFVQEQKDAAAQEEAEAKKKADEEQQKKDDEAKKKAKEEEQQKKEQEDAKLAADKLAQEQAAAAQEEAAIKIQKLYRGHTARKKFATLKEEKEEARKAKEEAEAKKKAAEEEQQKKEQEDAKLAADKLAQEQAAAAAQSTPLEYQTKTRVRQKQKRKPTKTGKEYQKQKQALEEKQIEHQKKTDLLSDLINLAETKISTSEGEIPTHQALKDEKLTQEQLDTLKKELESKINETNQYTDLGNLIESLYKTDKTLENKIGILTEMLNTLFPDSKDIKQFATKIFEALKLEPQECIVMIIKLINNTQLEAGIVKVKSYEINDKIRKLLTSAISEFKTKIISLANRLTEPVDMQTIQTAIDNLKSAEFTHVTTSFDNLKFTPEERQANVKLDNVIKAIETRTQKIKTEQDKKAHDTAETAAAEAKEAQEKKLAAAEVKKKEEETAKAQIQQEWDSEISKIQQIAPENIKISDLNFIKEDKYKQLKLDETLSNLMLKFIQYLCNELDQKNDEYLKNLTDLLVKIKNKKIFDKDPQHKDFALCEQYVNTWNLLNKIYQKRNIIVENVSLSGTQITKAQAYGLKQSEDINISEIKTCADKLADAKKFPNLSQLLKNMIQANIINRENLQIIHTILHNVLDAKYEDLVKAIKESIDSVTGTEQPELQQPGKDVKTQTPKQPSPESPKKPDAPPQVHESSKSQELKAKLLLLKQNLENLKIKLSQLSQKLENLKKALPKKETL